VDATLKTEFEAAGLTTFTAVSIALSGGTIYLVSGGADITISSQLYSAYNATYGALGEVDIISDGIDGQTTRATITLHPPSSVAIGNLSAADEQDARVFVYQGAVNTATGASIGTVETLFRGELDYPSLAINEAGYALTLECGTEEARLLERNEERKLVDSFHQACFSGELGLEKVTALVRKVYWRATATVSAGSNVNGKGLSGVINRVVSSVT
jgi:hypothetical protein